MATMCNGLYFMFLAPPPSAKFLDPLLHIPILLFWFELNIKGFIEDTKCIPRLVLSLLCRRGPTMYPSYGLLIMGSDVHFDLYWILLKFICNWSPIIYTAVTCHKCMQPMTLTSRRINFFPMPISGGTPIKWIVLDLLNRLIKLNKFRFLFCSNVNIFPSYRARGSNESFKHLLMRTKWNIIQWYLMSFSFIGKCFEINGHILYIYKQFCVVGA